MVAMGYGRKVWRITAAESVFQGTSNLTTLRALKSLSLSWSFNDMYKNNVSTRGLRYITKSFPPTLKVLNLLHNKLGMRFAPFPPSLQVLDGSFNLSLGADAWPEQWIDALPSSLRMLDIRSCRIDEEMGALLLVARGRIGAMAAGVAKLRIVTDARLVDVYDGHEDDLPFNQFERSTIEALVSPILAPRPTGNWQPHGAY
ncbi:hypothetical protein GGF32_001975 [Allomyces javanicus]|nr:hypothetical protein GGF32_001975 [Allomyces javanicus]